MVSGNYKYAGQELRKHRKKYGKSYGSCSNFTNNKSVCLEDVRNFSNESDLIHLAKNDSDPWVRLKAVEKIDNESVLENIAKNDSHIKIRLAAVEKIDNESVLENIAKNDSHIKIRLAAVKKITYNPVLKKIAKNNSDKCVRLEAVERISDEDVLEDLVKSASYNDVRLAAAKKVNYNLVLESTDENIPKLDKKRKTKGSFGRKSENILKSNNRKINDSFSERNKDASESYNKRKANESFSGGNEYVPNSGETHEELMEYLSQYINLNNLPHYYKDDLERKIDDKIITTKEDLDDELAQKHREYGELIEIISDSDLDNDVKERVIKDIKKHKTTKENLIDIINKMKHLPPINTSIKKEKPKSENKDLIVCPSCGELSDKTRNFCKVCGINLIIPDDIICPECGRVLDEDETFCKVCGISLDDINIMDCPNCGNTCHRGDLFCDSCGFPFKNIKCPYCGAKWDKNKTSCKNCGFSLEDSDFVVCPKCSNICSKDENYCDFCGFEFKKPINNLIDNMQKYKSESESKSSYKKTSQKNNESVKKDKNHSFDQFLIDKFGSILSVQKEGSPPRLSFSKCMGFLLFLLSLLAAILIILAYKDVFMSIAFIFCGLIYYSIFRGIGAIVRIFKD